jgi:hypothetical protein
MLVYLQRNYDFPDLFRQTPGNSGKWEDLEFTFDQPSSCDYMVVLNHPRKNISVQCRKGGKILIIQEPPYKENDYFRMYFPYFDHIISGFDKKYSDKILNCQASLPWHIGKSYDELSEMECTGIGKKDKVSWITSNNNIFPQHKVRLDFIEYMKKKGYDFDLFGRGFNPIADKFEGISPYKYTIAAENYIGRNYFTEKISDAYLSWSMPVYSGCPNITDYFPAESLIQIDLNSPVEAFEKIQHAVENKLWDKNIDAIRHARELVLNKYQLFPAISEIIKSHELQNKFERIYIPADGLTRYEKLKKNIKQLLKF